MAAQFSLDWDTSSWDVGQMVQLYGLGIVFRAGLGFTVRLGPGYIYSSIYIHDLPMCPLPVHLASIFLRSNTINVN